MAGDRAASAADLLAQTEALLTASIARRDLLNKRISNLEQMVTFARQLNLMDDDDGIEGHWDDVRAATTGATDDTAQPNPFRRVAPPKRQGGATARVVAVIRARRRPMTKAELIEEFAVRSLTDPSFQRSAGSISQAAYRAVHAGDLIQDGGFFAVPGDASSASDEPTLEDPVLDEVEGGDDDA